VTLRAINLLHLALVVAFISSVSSASFEVVDVPVLGQDIYLEPEPPGFQATVTAYSSSPDETWGDPFITASGRRVFDGLVACPRALPFGTNVRIGDRTYQCYDRLHPKYDDRFDIWMSTKNAALAFGKRRLLVEVMEG
jgi:3D (Asp-Asp-Asp) domain-containing protein